MKRYIGLLGLTLFIGICLFGMYRVLEAREKAQSAPPLKGEIVMYTDIPSNLSSAIAEAYEKDARVRVKVMPLTEEQMQSHLENGEALGDVVMTSAEHLWIGKKKKVFKTMVLPDADVIPNQFKDPEGDWVGVYYDPIVFAVNAPFFTSKHEVYTSWESLVKEPPVRVAIPDFIATRVASNILFGFVEKYGDTHAMEYFKALKGRVTQYSKFVGTTVRLAAAGESDVGIASYSNVEDYVQKKYPIDLVYPTDGTMYILTGVALPKKSSKDVLAEDFVSWLLSKDFYTFMQESGYYYMYTNPEILKPKDALGHEVILFELKSDYTTDGKALLLKQWLDSVRF